MEQMHGIPARGGHGPKRNGILIITVLGCEMFPADRGERL